MARKNPVERPEIVVTTERRTSVTVPEELSAAIVCAWARGAGHIPTRVSDLDVIVRFYGDADGTSGCQIIIEFSDAGDDRP